MANVLIVEDEEGLLQMYKEKFEFEGFDVLGAHDGKEGVEVALEEKPDVIVLDILLPKKKGTKVLKEVRESGRWGGEVPVVMLTNLDTNDDILDAVAKYEPSYYFIKSNTELDDITDKVKELLNK